MDNISNFIPPTSVTEELLEKTNPPQTATVLNQKIISIAVDLAGSWRYSEIISISAVAYGFDEEVKFSQFVMPFYDISFDAGQLFRVRIDTFDRFRYMADLTVNREMPTKSLYKTLLNLIKWIKKIRGDSTERVLLAYYDINRGKVLPYLLNALKKYKLMESFKEIVEGFLNLKAVCRTFPEFENNPTSFHNATKILLGKKTSWETRWMFQLRSPCRAEITNTLVGTYMKLPYFNVEKIKQFENYLDKEEENQNEVDNIDIMKEKEVGDKGDKGNISEIEQKIREVSLTISFDQKMENEQTTA